MKIALVSPYDYAHPGGVIAHISHLGHQFARMGHHVKVIAPCSGNRDSLDGNSIVASTRAIPIPSAGSIARVSLSPRLPSRVKEVLEREQFDIVLIHEPLIPLLSLAALRSSNSVNVGTFHACHNTPRGYYYWHWLLKRYFKKLDGRIAVSLPAKEFVARHFPGDYRIIPNGIDFEHFSNDVPPIEEFCDGKLNILFVGRLEKRKGLDYLIKAYQGVKGEFPNSRLIVVGPGTRLRRKYEREVGKLKLKDVVFAGQVPYAELSRYHHTTDIFCAPATGEESFGIVLLEAMAAGKPIVASNIDGYASVLSDGVEGLLVPPRDEEALAGEINSLLSDRALRQQMGARGKATAEGYKWEYIAQRVMDYYLELLGSSSPRGCSN